MSFFGRIMDKIFHPAKAATPGAARPAPPPVAAPTASQAPAPAPAAPTPAEPVDVEAVLAAMAELKGDAGNWRASIVDLLKLLDLDSSLEARKELAAELGVEAGAAGSPEQNMALQKAVMRKLAENGGMVPDSLRN